MSLGVRMGRGHNAPTKTLRVPVKEIFGYPLTPRWRELLASRMPARTIARVELSIYEPEDILREAQRP